mgnify:CR=1 FL=1
MAKLSKRVKAFRERVDANKSYPLNESIAILKETATAKFNESVEIAVNLGIDARKSDQGLLLELQSKMLQSELDVLINLQQTCRHLK